MQSKNSNILEVEIKRSIDCSSEVAKWNYWDHEHLDVVHGGYKSVDILYDDNNCCFFGDKRSLWTKTKKGFGNETIK